MLFRNGGVLNIELYCEGNDPAPETESEKETWNDWVEMFANVELTDDSFMEGYNCGFLCSNGGASHLQMNEHRLTVDEPAGQHFYAGDLTVEGGGEIYVRKAGGWFDLGGSSGSGGKYVSAGTTTLRVGNAAIYDVGGEHVFGSYVSEYTGGWDDANTVIKVLESFKPNSRPFLSASACRRSNMGTASAHCRSSLKWCSSNTI